MAAAKTGMLFSAPIIHAIAEGLATKNFPLVVDPVSVSQSGHLLLQEDAVTALVKHILPLADLLTPNRPEAEMLAGMSIETPEDVREAIGRILAMGPRAVLLKGGHFEGGDTLIDWYGQPGCEPVPLLQARVETPNNHGTGCTLSAAIATFLGHGCSMRDAIVQGQAYLNQCLQESYTPGKGFGPPNHAAPWEQRR